MNENPVISNNLRIRYPEHFLVGPGSIVDDFSYFSTCVTIGKYCHIANNVSIAGGSGRMFTLGDFSSISAGVRIWCSSDNFACDMAVLAPPPIEITRNTISGNVTIDDLTIVGCNSVIMPSNHIPQGVAIGALSFVPPDYHFKEWALYAGIPIRFIRPRDKDEVLRQKNELISKLDQLRLQPEVESREFMAL